MTYGRAVCIYNPSAGRGMGQSKLDAIRQILSADVRDVSLAPTELPGHATELAERAAAGGCDLVAVYSGDGTVNEVVQALAGRESPALLVLPGGTANVLANEVGLPTDPLTAARLLPQLAAKPVRLGRAVFGGDGSSRYFLLMCGAGLDAAIADRVSKPLKRSIGQAAYWLAGARFSIQRFPRARISAAGQRHGQPFVRLGSGLEEPAVWRRTRAHARCESPGQPLCDRPVSWRQSARVRQLPDSREVPPDVEVPRRPIGVS